MKNKILNHVIFGAISAQFLLTHVVLSYEGPHPQKLDSITLVGVSILQTDDPDTCKIIRTKEPRAIMTYMIPKGGTHWEKVSSPIYSDLCASMLLTQQFITKLYYYFDADINKPLDHETIIGFSNDDDKALSYPKFTSYIFK